jgi:hypothetical protein
MHSVIILKINNILKKQESVQSRLGQYTLSIEMRLLLSGSNPLPYFDGQQTFRVVQRSDPVGYHVCKQELDITLASKRIYK